MNSSGKTQLSQMNGRRYATKQDFRRIFIDQMSPLYRLSLLLTGNSATAERCFIVALDECIRTERVPIERSYFRAKRAIMQNAIRILQLHFNRRRLPAKVGRRDRSLAHRVDNDSAISWLLSLPDFDRVVFVMSILEQYSDATSAFLLCCSLEDIRSARARALVAVAESAFGPRNSAVARAIGVDAENRY